MSTRTTEVLRGARRVESYIEGEQVDISTTTPPDPKSEARTTAPVPAPAPTRPAPTGRVQTSSTAVRTPGATPGTAVMVQPKRREAPATWGARGRLVRGSAGLMKLAPSTEELAHRQALGQIRSATWPRAVNVMVTNPKGGVGKTPATLLLAGILAHIRGGYVAAWEAAESIGTLARRSEGSPMRGLAELLAGHESVTSAGSLGGFTAPQTSHADVIGSVGERPQLTSEDIASVRQVLDTYYRITVTDTGNNPMHPAYLAALRSTDVVVIPCLVSIDAIAGLEEVLALIEADPVAGDDSRALFSRAVVVLGHDGGPENDEITDAITDRLASLGVTTVEVPFDPAIRLGGQISLADLTETSTRAWTIAAATVITALNAAPTDIDLNARGELAPRRGAQEK